MCSSVAVGTSPQTSNGNCSPVSVEYAVEIMYVNLSNYVIPNCRCPLIRGIGGYSLRYGAKPAPGGCGGHASPSLIESEGAKNSSRPRCCCCCRRPRSRPRVGPEATCPGTG